MLGDARGRSRQGGHRQRRGVRETLIVVSVTHRGDSAGVVLGITHQPAHVEVGGRHDLKTLCQVLAEPFCCASTSHDIHA